MRACQNIRSSTDMKPALRVAWRTPVPSIDSTAVLNLLVNAPMNGADERIGTTVVSGTNDVDDHVHLTMKESDAGFGPDGRNNQFEGF
jgi:hypothetical protein